MYVDRITALEARRSIRVTKVFGSQDTLLSGYLPSLDLVPQMLIVEGIAQATQILFLLSSRKESSDKLAGGSLASVSAEFQGSTLVGQEVTMDVVVVKLWSVAIMVEATATTGEVGDRKWCVKATMTMSEPFTDTLNGKVVRHG